MFPVSEFTRQISSLFLGSSLPVNPSRKEDPLAQPTPYFHTRPFLTYSPTFQLPLSLVARPSKTFSAVRAESSVSVFLSSAADFLSSPAGLALLTGACLFLGPGALGASLVARGMALVTRGAMLLNRFRLAGALACTLGAAACADDQIFGPENRDGGVTLMSDVAGVNIFPDAAKVNMSPDIGMSIDARVNADALVYPDAAPPPNHPPQIDPLQDRQVEDGQTLSFMILARDSDGDPLQLGINSPSPQGATFTVGQQFGPLIPGTFSWTPDACGADRGNHTVTFVVTDGRGGRAERSININVTEPNFIERVSVGSGGVEGNGGVGEMVGNVLSSDGRYVVFASSSSNLVSGDTNNTADVFVHDRVNHTTERISVANGGREVSGASIHSSISIDGRYVAFESDASNLVSGDTNGVRDIFVYDRVNRTTERVSIGSGGVQANGSSQWSSISADGRYVVFISGASNLVSGDTNRTGDIFVHDRVNHTTERVSIGNGGVEANTDSAYALMSADGRYVVFASGASNLILGDTNNEADIFVHDRTTHTTERVNVGNGNVQANDSINFLYSISADGRYVAFESGASNLVLGDTNGTNDIFVHDRMNHITERVSIGSGSVQANGFSFSPSISENGRYVVFSSDASNLVPGDTNNEADIFVHDRTTHTTQRVSIGVGSIQANDWSSYPSISSTNGLYMSFVSNASNLVSGDTNAAAAGAFFFGGSDAFVVSLRHFFCR